MVTAGTAIDIGTMAAGGTGKILIKMLGRLGANDQS
jgi:hypothetical protein